VIINEMKLFLKLTRMMSSTDAFTPLENVSSFIPLIVIT
jgi:hypothetical protein